MLVAALVISYVRAGSTQTAQLTEIVTIRCSETGKTWTLPRGAIEKQLMMRPYPVNPDEGLTNPETGKPTGFPVDEWKTTVANINSDRATLIKQREASGGASPKPAPAPKPPGGK